jgi:hypothetical protein
MGAGAVSLHGGFLAVINNNIACRAAQKPHRLLLQVVIGELPQASSDVVPRKGRRGGRHREVLLSLLFINVVKKIFYKNKK